MHIYWYIYVLPLIREIKDSLLSLMIVIVITDLVVAIIIIIFIVTDIFIFQGYN